MRLCGSHSKARHVVTIRNRAALPRRDNRRTEVRLMGHVLRRGLAVLAIGLALAPLSAYAEDGNQAAINAAKARQAWLQNMTPLQEGVALGQAEIANANAIARLLSWDAHAQTYVPNSMKQYEMFCSMAIQHVQAQVANANVMASARPWDPHAQAEVANA